MGPRADADPLAREIRRRIVANLEQGSGARAFRRMWGTVVIVAVDPEEEGAPPSAPGGRSSTTLTLRFDWGRLMIHEGRVGRPDVTLWGSPESILALGHWGSWPRALTRWTESLRDRWSDRLRPVLRLPALLGATSRAPSRGQGATATPGAQPPGLKIYGGTLHLRFVWRLARLLAEPA